MNLLKDYNKIDIAIERIKAFEPPEGYYLAFSGGKDSQVIYHLAKMAGIKFDAHFNVTTVDPPELIRFIRENYPDVIFERPKKSMRKLIIEHSSPPTRIRRFCCEHLKENGGGGRFVMTGIRAAESNSRSRRGIIEDDKNPKKMVQSCITKRKKILNPIIDWTDTEVWNFISSRGLKYCCLYDQGFARIGCIGCPLAGSKMMEIEFKKWPYMKMRYLSIFSEMLLERKEKGLPEYWKTPEEVFSWWIGDHKILKINGINRILFDCEPKKKTIAGAKEMLRDHVGNDCRFKVKKEGKYIYVIPKKND